MLYSDRSDAGRQLGAALGDLRDDHVVVVGLPRGGVPVAFEVAKALDAPLDVVVVRKLGLPHQPELAMGAVGEGDVRVLNHEVIGMAGVTIEELVAVEERERAEVERRAQWLRSGRAPELLLGRTVVIVDDGIATGSTARAACQVVRGANPAKVILAVPVAPADWEERMAGAADELIALESPADLHGVGQFYRDFSQVDDDEVARCLSDAATTGDGARFRTHRARPTHTGREETREIPLESVTLLGQLTVPPDPKGLVLFAHGSGSSRLSPRNRSVAEVLQRAGLATLLFDLLSGDEEVMRANVFDVELLAERLIEVTEWIRTDPELAGLPVGYFGASTGAAAALQAAAAPDADVAAVVSRGGRPDLAHDLDRVEASTLLIAGGRDSLVLELNRTALATMSAEHQLQVVEGATHLFEEPGALETVAGLARDWFSTHLDRAGNGLQAEGVGR